MLRFCVRCKWPKMENLDAKFTSQPAEGTAAQGSLSPGWGCHRVFPSSREKEAPQHGGLLLPVMFAPSDGSGQGGPRSGGRFWGPPRMTASQEARRDGRELWHWETSPHAGIHKPGPAVAPGTCCGAELSPSTWLSRACQSR